MSSVSTVIRLAPVISALFFVAIFFFLFLITSGSSINPISLFYTRN